jgi:hypothetical protein
MPNIYDNIDTQNIDLTQHNDGENTDRIEERNKYPEVVDENRDSLSTGTDKLKTTVDFFQVHPHHKEFGSTTGLFSFYDPISPDRQLFDVIEQEAIMLGSAPMKYYKMNHELADIDPLYNETLRRDTYSSPEIIFGYYEDPTPMQELTKYGLNQAETIDIWFNYNYILGELGGKLELGDLILTYDNKLWEVMSSIILDEALWRAQHNNVKVVRVQPQGYVLPDLGQVEDTRPQIVNDE